MLFKFLTSVKLFLFITVFMFMSFVVSLFLLKGYVVHEVGLLSSLRMFPLFYKVFIAFSIISLILIGIQTFICSLLSPSGLLSVLMHVFAGISLVLMASFSTLKTYTFKIYPETYVKVGSTVIALEDFKFDRKNMNFDALFSVKRSGKTVKSHVSYNHPLISFLGNVWVSDIRPSYYGFEIEAKYQPFSVLPFALFVSSLIFLLLLSVKVVKR